MNLYQYISAMKTEGTQSPKSFVYKNSKDWIDLERGIFPQGLRGNSFTIKFENISLHEEMTEYGYLNVRVEFLADARNDIYAKKFNDMQLIIKDMCSIADDNSDNTTFYMADSEQYKTCSFDYFDELVLITFGFKVLIDIRAT